MKNLEIMQTFSLDNMPSLDVCVLGALELFMKKRLPVLKIPYKKPLVIGSGNAAATGKILFYDREAVFANENDFLEKLKTRTHIDGVVLISASGSKHASGIAKACKKHGKHLTLITNTPHSLSSNYLDRKHVYDEFVFPKNREPYTYNTSTYLGMILGKTKEKPKAIHEFLTKRLTKLKLPNFKTYDKFYFILPKEFSEMRAMLHTKFEELFGRRVSREVETAESIKHATTVVPSNELFISFGYRNRTYGKHRLYVPLPAKADYATLMAAAYFVIGKIQNQKEDYFRKNIVAYCKKASKIFGQKISPIVK